ncbi:hypothetical protein G6F70_007311 [Rhizopus microsporus]|uniref:Mitochondrial cardiolipin hydrolase n=2 Tax=Rhizopus TaxID=4842 RepID=A0A367JVA5_RHIAZ|nr:hypothetical protein G6F71_007060 [Rhizopus microsporus]RCH93837.1 hypothetical protein CU097_013417 [Rhizopus azygosporus]KAG1196605.1 hypothetical protein G6F70_007311 [Rhizopus microsporus]KAG1208329.1 hypothetical protein G6F69_007308 [Rhizopus microsporus]KAG1229670.1 hypothetical protein G6F67_006984 [Rhizopus microsporus]
MTQTLPWDQDTPLSISELLKQSMGSVNMLASDNSLLSQMSTHLNGLLRHRQDDPLQVFDKLFHHAEKAMTSETDRQVLSVLKCQVSSFIGVTLGVEPFLEQDRKVKEEKEEDEGEKLSLSAAIVKEEEHKKSAWEQTKAFYHQMKVDIFGPEHSEHERLRQLAEEHYGEHSAEEESGDDDDEYEEIEETVQIKSREIGAPDEFKVVRRRQKKKKTTTTKITFNSPYTSSDMRQPPRHPIHVREFRPRSLEPLPEDTFCIPIFFPSEESYGVFHAALASAKRTLYICVFSLTDNDTADVIGDAYQRGLDVRIITDNDQMDSRKGADVLLLNERYGIPYKYDNSDQFMHNKFAVIDNKTVITGSFNWSCGARYKNRENVIITNIPSVVDAYSKEFDKLWDYF